MKFGGLNRTSKAFIVFIGFILLNAFFHFQYHHSDRYRVDKENIYETLHEKEKYTHQIIQSFARHCQKENFQEILYQSASKYYQLFAEKGITFFIYEKDTLRFWTDNSITVPEAYSPQLLNRPVIQLDNGWFVVKKKTFGETTLLGLILIKRVYSYENEFLTNHYHQDFNISDKVSIDTANHADGIKIHSKYGEYLFTLKPPESEDKKSVYLNLFFIFFLLSIIGLFLFLNEWLKKKIPPLRKNLILLVIILVVSGLRFLMIKMNMPEEFHGIDLFNSRHYAHSLCFNSLGALFTNALLIFFFAWLIYSHAGLFPGNFRRMAKPFVAVLAGLIMGGYFLFLLELFKSLINDSTINFEFYRILNINYLSLTGFLVIALLLASFMLITDKIIYSFSGSSSKSFLLYYILLPPAMAMIVLFFVTELVSLYSVIFYVLFTIAFIYSRQNRKPYQYAHFALIILILALYTLAFIENTTRQKMRRESRVLAVNLANERDQIAEILFKEIESKVKNDKFVNQFVKGPIESDTRLEAYLQEKYFTGYYNKYDFQVTICDSTHNLLLENTDEMVHCYSFFADMIDEEGIEVPNTSFYFLENLNGRISYLGRLVFEVTDNPDISLFISLDSKLISEQLGYPELLLTDNLNQPKYLESYSYAKYHNGNLITRYGDYSFKLKCTEMCAIDKEFAEFREDHHRFLIYNVDDENVIILTYPGLKVRDAIASFTYIFIFLFILLNILSLFTGFPWIFEGFRNNFKNKIKLSMIGIMLLSLVITAAATIIYSIHQSERNHYERINEKIQSVLVELENELGFEQSLDNRWENYLTYLLRELSNIFYTDINLFNQRGELLATSRPEIYRRGLIGERMNQEAFYHLIIKNKARYIHEETIGKLDYISAYVPFMNMDNKVLAYINLPYFTKQNALTNEIYTIAIALLNIYAVLIALSILIAIFISNKLTEPLRLIQDRIREISLKKQNKPIHYESDDEIGDLVKDYNRMVNELSVSAEKLARSERESAWREMAKQIAHEIKNPLTPMKLSVQHLKRSWKAKSAHWEENFERITNSLIEQIDNMSYIATEFSNFAKMPRAKNRENNIISIINYSVQLFSEYEHVNFKLKYDQEGDIRVYADREQLIRVFSNLIKNGIQAIPKSRGGKITVEVLENGTVEKDTEVHDDGTVEKDALVRDDGGTVEKGTVVHDGGNVEKGTEVHDDGTVEKGTEIHDDGTVEKDAEVHDDDETFNKGTVTVKVSDNGKGINEDARDKLFQPSFTTKSSGMGLGLAIVKSIIESLDGQIWFESEVGKGTSFYVRVPVLGR